MKKIITLALTLLAIQGSAFAVLPPLYQSLTELKTIINDERLGQYLQSGDLITDIRKVNDGYLIETNRGQLLAKVVYQPNNMPGPARFKIEFEQANGNAIQK